MDTIVRVVYNGSTYDLHLAEDLPLRLDISAVEAGEVGSFFSVGSQEFYLPGTKENNTFFNHAYNISSDDIPGMYNSVQAYIIKKGETVLEGQLQLHEVVTNINSEYVMYKCTIVDSVIAFKDQLASKLIKDADWSAYSHSISSQSILQSWEGNLNNGSIFYPLAEYGYDTNVDESNMPVGGFIPLGNPTVGQYYNQPFTPLLPLQLLPSVRAKDVVDVIFDQVNFVPTGSWYDDGASNNLYILPKGQEQGGVTVSSGLTPTFNAYMTGFPLQSVSSSAYSYIGPVVEYNGVYTNNLNQYDNQCWYYETKGVGTHKFNASITFFNPVWFTPNQTVKVKITIEAGSRVCNGSGTSGTVKFSNEVELTSADGFNSFTLETGGEDFVTSPGQDWWVRVQYTYSTSGPVPNLTLYTGNFSCTRAPQVYDGAIVNMGEQFDSRTKSLDIITGLLQQFNLVLQPDPTNERAIRIDYFDQWVRDGRFVDWTDRYDTSKNESINHTIDEVERILTFKQEKDEDRFSKLAIENTPNLEYGSIEVIADNNLSQGERSIGSYFAPLILQSPFEWNSLDDQGNRTWNIDTSINMAWPALYKFENNNIKTFKFKPRIGYKTEIDITNDYRIYFGNPGAYETLTGSYYTLTNTEAYPAISGSSNDTLYNNSFGNFVNSQANINNSVSGFQGNWKTYVDSLYWEGSKKLTLDIEFDSNDYKDIRLNDKVYIKDNYYRINKISGFNVSKDDVATVELIKLYPAYFQQNVVNVPVPVAPVAPVPISPPTPAPTITPVPTIAPVSPSPSPAPAPVAPSPVTPVPIQPRPPATIGTFYLTQASGTSNTCALNTTTAVYALTTTLSDIGTTVNTLYADPQCTVPFFGNGYYYGIGASSGVLPTYQLVVMGTGVVNSRTTCPTVTPAPTSAGEFYKSTGEGSSTNACTRATNDGSLFSPYAPSVEYVQSGDYVYTDAGFTTPFVGNNYWYGLSNPGVPTSQMAIQVNIYGRVVSRVDCVPLPPAPPPPTPVPAPITVGTFYLSDILGTSGPGCTSLTDGYTVYAATADINDILSGSVSTIYSDNTLSTGFFGNGWYYGVSDVSSGSAKGTLEILGTGVYSVASTCTTLGSMTSASIDNGSTIGAEGCFNPPTQTIYLRDDLYTILNNGGGIAYTDIYTNDRFQGTSGRYMIHQSASVDPAGNAYPEARGIVTINGTGVISTYQICGTSITAFSASSNNNLSVDVCNEPFTFTVYSDTITSTSQLVQGTRLYRNEQLNVELSDNTNWVITDISGSDGYSVTGSSFRYLLIAGATGIQDCIPAPPPPVPPVLDPLFSSSISQGYTFGYGCFSPLTGSVYHTEPLEDIAANGGGCFYSDIYGQYGFNGQNRNYRIHQSGSTIASGSGTVTYGPANITTAIANTGCTTNFRQNCGTGSAFQFYATDGSTFQNTDQCSGEVGEFSNTFYTTDFYDVADAQDCDRIFTDAALSIQLADGSKYAIANDYRCFGYESGSYARRISYSLIACGGAGGLTLQGDNSGSCSSVPNSQGYSRFVGPRKEDIIGSFTCGSNLPGVTWQYYYLSGTGTDRAKTIPNGTRVYLDVSGSTEFTGSYLALSTVDTDYEGNVLYGQPYEVTMDYNAGVGIANISYCDMCPLPAPVPVPVAPPTPPTFNAWSGTSALSGNVCIYTTPNTYYTTASIQLSEWAPGMRLYTDSGTTTEITADGLNIGIENPVTQPNVSEIYVYYTQANGVESVTSCAAPTPTPVTPSPAPAPVAPPPPVPAPVTSFTVYNNAGYSSATGCSHTVTNTRFAATSSANLQNGDIIYTNGVGGQVFDGLDLNYGFGDTGNGNPEIQAFVSSTGVLSQVTVCPPPPVPVTSYSHDRSNYNQFSTNVCSASFTGTVYTSVTWANIGINTYIFTDSGLNNPLDGGNGSGGSGWWRVGDTSNSYILLIESSGRVANVFFCQ